MVSFVNAHGTSTQLNDKMETKAIKLALGEDLARKVMVSSSKSMTGHMLGAAAGIESAVCALTIRDGVIFPTINYEMADAYCDLNYTPNKAVAREINKALIIARGRGGINAILAVEKE